MRKSVKDLVKSLPGPKSYCNCKKLCSPQTVDHILPKRILKSKLWGKDFKEAINDPHNLISCCRKLNQSKADKILGESPIDGKFDGFISRSYLYMNHAYNLGIDVDLVNQWKWFSLLNKPLPFEFDRDFAIASEIRGRNPYVQYYPTTSLNMRK